MSNALITEAQRPKSGIGIKIRPTERIPSLLENVKFPTAFSTVFW